MNHIKIYDFGPKAMHKAMPASNVGFDGKMGL